VRVALFGREEAMVRPWINPSGGLPDVVGVMGGAKARPSPRFGKKMSILAL
jgi:hypothetical protein